VGEKVAVRKLIERMIVRSSNLATNVLLGRAEPAEVTSRCRALGCKDTEVVRRLQDAKAFDAGKNNVTSAHDLALLLAAIGEERVPGAKEMRSVLARQELNEGIPAGLPHGTKVAHKTGSITKHYHDAALVLPEGEKGYVLVVLTRGMEEKDAVALVRAISKLVWESR
jgi:beta-lactamase class A